MKNILVACRPAGQKILVALRPAVLVIFTILLCLLFKLLVRGCALNAVFEVTYFLIIGAGIIPGLYQKWKVSFFLPSFTFVIAFIIALGEKLIAMLG